MKLFAVLAALALLAFATPVAVYADALPMEEIIETETAPSFGEKDITEKDATPSGVKQIDLAETGGLPLDYVGGNDIGGNQNFEDIKTRQNAKVLINQSAATVSAAVKGTDDRLLAKAEADADSQRSVASAIGDDDKLRQAGMNSALDLVKGGMNQLASGNIDAAMGAFGHSIVMLTAVKKPTPVAASNGHSTTSVNWKNIVLTVLGIGLLAALAYGAYRLGKHLFSRIRNWWRARKERKAKDGEDEKDGEDDVAKLRRENSDKDNTIKQLRENLAAQKGDDKPEA